jgi:hypothetical protein
MLQASGLKPASRNRIAGIDRAPHVVQGNPVIIQSRGAALRHLATNVAMGSALGRQCDVLKHPSEKIGWKAK